MKFRRFSSVLIPVVFLGMISCKEKKQEEGLLDKAAEAVEELKQEITPPILEELEKISPEERASKLGFAKYLPADTEAMISVYNVQQSAESLQALELWKLFISNADAAGLGGVELDEEDMLESEQVEEFAADEEIQDGPDSWMLLGQEVTLAFGSSAGEQLGNVLKANQRTSYFQMEAVGRAMHEFAMKGESADFLASLSQGLEYDLWIKFLKDRESGTKLLDKLSMPPMYIAFRAKEGELEAAAQKVNSGMMFFGMAGEMAAPVEFQTAGSTFQGYKLLGEKISQQMAESRKSMEKDLSSETIDELLAIVAKKNLIVATGTIGDYVVVMVGGDEDEFKLETDLQNSVAAAGKVEFVDEYIEKQLISASFGDKELLQTLIKQAGGIGTYALGLREGIAAGDSLGETRDIEEMLRLIADREEALLTLGSSSDLGMVAFLENGVKIESFGGYDKGAVNWDGETKLAHLGSGETDFMFLNISGDAAYDENRGEYLEAIFETGYALAMKFPTLEFDEPNARFTEMKAYVKLFDEKFRKDMLGVYETLTGEMAEGLGHETAVVIDLKGSVPAAPGIPQVVVDEAKAPRITLIKPVTDREKLATAWENLDENATSLLGGVSEMFGKKIPMQKPISAQTDDMVTWFIALPFFQDDFLPSVTVSDDWFAASTSKTHAVEVVSEAAAGGESGVGVKFHINFTALSDYAEEMLGIAEKHSAVIFEDEDQLARFNKQKSDYGKMIAASREFEALDWTVKKEQGVVRSRVHFKTK